MSKKGIEDLKKEYEEIRMSEVQVDAFRSSIEKAKKDNRRSSSLRVWKNLGTVAAAVVIAFIILPNTTAGVAHAMERIPMLGNVVKVVTFRDYTYEDDTQLADIDVPHLEVEENAGGNAVVTDAGGAGNTPAYNGENSNNEGAMLSLEESVTGINQDIDALTNRIVKEFEADIREQTGVKEVMVSHEVIATPERYFTLKLTHYEAAADGAENVYYYTVDLLTGERVALKDLFAEDADYISIISEEIIRQMRVQMASDENIAYWVDEEFEEWNFKGITEETQFYINSDNQLIISFNEGEVAPMYMGVVTFVIPQDVMREIRR